MKAFQEQVGAWGDETFPHSTPASVVAHLMDEVGELADDIAHANNDGIPSEAADCFLLLLHTAHKCGFDLQEEAERKFLVNKGRRWGEPDERGVVRHVEESS